MRAYLRCPASAAAFYVFAAAAAVVGALVPAAAVAVLAVVVGPTESFAPCFANASFVALGHSLSSS